MTTPCAPDDDDSVEYVDDPDLRASLDEPAIATADEVMAAIDDMIEAYRRAVA